ncbi:MAG: HEAT repeat domain-containing protein [Planctomycetota bacterium]
MITQKQLNKWKHALRSTVPVIGPMRQRAAIKALEEHRDHPETIPLLAEAATISQKDVSERAAQALANLKAQPAIDALCALWAKGRQERLGAIVAEQGYIASKPLRVKVLSILKCRKRLATDRADVARFFVSLLRDRDEVLRTGAEKSLKNASPGPAQDALCEEAIQNPKGQAAKLCVERGFRPSDHERLCLFLFVTRQLDAYFKEDYEFQSLKLEYDRAGATVQGHVMEVVRSGDRRCAGFFGTKSKPLTECSETEIKLAMDSWARHRDWVRLFQACLELPLKYSFAAFPLFRDSGWQPDSEDLRSAYRQILADTDGQGVPETRATKAESPLFEQWLGAGGSGEWARMNAAELLQRLKSATPPEGVGLVAALAAATNPSAGAVEAVRDSPHWPIRLAGYTTGLLQDLTSDAVEDPNYWVGELASASSVLELWPGKATPADLEALKAAPFEAFIGKLGAARKVLRTIMGHRITTGTFEDMVIEAGEFAGEFVDAGGPEFETEQES